MSRRATNARMDSGVEVSATVATALADAQAGSGGGGKSPTRGGTRQRQHQQSYNKVPGTTEAVRSSVQNKEN